MPMWRCPHCGTPQAEAARCWVCRRSSTACGTCRHFRRGVAANLGYCGLDRRRQPLAGDEIRACWEAGGSGPTAEQARDGALPDVGGAAWLATGEAASRRLDFVEVTPSPAPVDGDRTAAATSEPPAPPAPAITPPLPQEPGWSLWSELER